MGSLHHLQDAHEQAQMLMPWRVNGTLDDAEAALFDAHLAECAECRADLEAEIALRAKIATMPIGSHSPGFARAGNWQGRKRHATALRQPSPVRRFLGRRVALGWALAGQAAVAATLIFAVAIQRDPPEQDGYRLLASGEAQSGGNMIVLFAPASSQREMRSALEQSGGRLVDGPTASGAYIVRVTPGERAAAIERLRGMAQVVLAEPIDAERTP